MSTKADISLWQLCFIFFKLGCTSFGGPVAHLGYFRYEFVEKRRWYSEQSYADIVALCQFLPGPASSQVGIAIGFTQAGYRGALLCWLGFTLPSALMMAVFAYLYIRFGQNTETQWISALKIVAVAVVAQALWAMSKSLCPDISRISIALLSAVGLLLFPGIVAQLSVLLLAGIIGWRVLPANLPARINPPRLSLRAPMVLLLLFFALLLGLPWLADSTANDSIRLFDSFYRAGALVFGGGHVVLPLLQAELVPSGWITADAFVAGYGAAQAVPGPLFTLATYLGAVTSGWQGAVLATTAIFLPAFLLIFATLPLWQHMRQYASLQSAMAGINAAVVGILLAALYQPVFTSAIADAGDLSAALLAFAALKYWKIPPYLVVLVATALALVISGMR